MKPHNLDGYIRGKLQEGESGLPLPGRKERDRTWISISDQLDTKPGYSWIKVAALILMIFMPSGFLLQQNRKQNEVIAGLRGSISAPVILHDTIRLPGQAIVKTQTDTVEVFRYITDTIVIYLSAEQLAIKETPALDSHTIAAEASAGRINFPEVTKTEYVLPVMTKPERQTTKNEKSFSIRFQ